MADEKQDLRTILKQARDAIPAAFAASTSARIQQSLLGAESYRRAAALVLYAAFGNEVDTSAIFAHCHRSRPVYYPRIQRHSDELILCRIDSSDMLVRGRFGFPEPPDGATTVDPANLRGALLVVPGLAFTPRGERLGRGGGHYDRLLARLSPEAATVGLAYSFQLLDRLPQAIEDRRVHHVITEAGVYQASDLAVRRDAADPLGGTLADPSLPAVDRNQGGISR